MQVPGGDASLKDKFKPAKLTIQKVQKTHLCSDVAGRLRGGYQLMRSDEKDSNGQPICYTVEKRVRVGGENITDAAGTYHESRPAVTFRFDTIGARKFCKASRENINRQLAIILDRKVISAPVINEAICQGNGVITGRFSIKEAQELALLIRGALPAGVTFLEERSVGPGLGRDLYRGRESSSHNRFCSSTHFYGSCLWEIWSNGRYSTVYKCCSFGRLAICFASDTYLAWNSWDRINSWYGC